MKKNLLLLSLTAAALLIVGCTNDAQPEFDPTTHYDSGKTPPRLGRQKGPKSTNDDNGGRRRPDSDDSREGTYTRIRNGRRRNGAPGGIRRTNWAEHPRA